MSSPNGWPVSAKIYDLDGNLINEILVTAYSVQVNNKGRKYEIEGIGKPVYTDDSDLKVGGTCVDDDVCAHVWKLYQGILDSFAYCDKCGVKK